MECVANHCPASPTPQDDVLWNISLITFAFGIHEVLDSGAIFNATAHDMADAERRRFVDFGVEGGRVGHFAALSCVRVYETMRISGTARGKTKLNSVTKFRKKPSPFKMFRFSTH
jgi:hypothetical protein